MQVWFTTNFLCTWKLQQVRTQNIELRWQRCLELRGRAGRNWGGLASGSFARKCVGSLRASRCMGKGANSAGCGWYGLRQCELQRRRVPRWWWLGARLQAELGWGGSWRRGARHPCGCTLGRRRGSRTAIWDPSVTHRVVGSGLVAQGSARGRHHRWWKGRRAKVGGRESTVARAWTLCKDEDRSVRIMRDGELFSPLPSGADCGCRRFRLPATCSAKVIAKCTHVSY
jgi:hypothetical protein